MCVFIEYGVNVIFYCILGLRLTLEGLQEELVVGLDLLHFGLFHRVDGGDTHRSTRPAARRSAHHLTRVFLRRHRDDKTQDENKTNSHPDSK